MALILNADIIKACISNDRAAQKLLFDNFKNAMFTVALRILNNSDSAHDVIQEAFIEIFENIADLRNPAALGSWIKTTVVRKALLKLKREKIFEPLTEANKIEHCNCDVDFTADELNKAILNLPESARAVFVLIEVEGYKHAEVADMLNISIGTSKSQLFYSKQLLRKKLADFYN